VLDDKSMRASPMHWAKAAVDLAFRHGADAIVHESNIAGLATEAVLRQYCGNKIRIRGIHASRGKQARAAPVLSCHERELVHHVGAFPQLEDELCTWEPDSGAASPNRLDALVLGVTEILLRPRNAAFERATTSFRYICRYTHADDFEPPIG
jgi:phage terminase large subunit-like protein